MRVRVHVCARVLNPAGHDQSTVSHLVGSMTYQDVRRKCSGVFHTREKTLGSFKPLLFIYVPASPPAGASKKNERKTKTDSKQPPKGTKQRPVVELRPAAQLTRFGIEERQFSSWCQRLTHSTCNLQKSPALVTLQDGASHRHR